MEYFTQYLTQYFCNMNFIAIHCEWNDVKCAICLSDEFAMTDVLCWVVQISHLCCDIKVRMPL